MCVNQGLNAGWTCVNQGLNAGWKCVNQGLNAGWTCVYRGSQVYMCNLDAEGAFDALPFPVIFSKLYYHVLPEMCWKILYNW